MTKQISPNNNLTSYKPASIKEIMAISVPIMISSLSGLLMNFFDRLILSNYAESAMNAAATGGMTACIFTFSAMGITLIAEVFVGKRNGARDFKNVSSPAWQMIWFALFSTIPFLFIASFLSQTLVSKDFFDGQATLYFKIWMLFGPAFALVGALSAFFTGVGKVKTVTIATIIANSINIVLDYILVFGFKNFIPAMGIKGAAIATVTSQLIQVLILGIIFLGPKMHEKFNTRKLQLDLKLMVECIKVGTPNTIGHVIEIAAWAFVLRLMIAAGQTHVTVLTIGQSILQLFFFASDGLQKGVSTIGANIIGKKETHLMKKLLLSSLSFLSIVMAIIFIPIVLYPDPIIKAFLIDIEGSQSQLYYYTRLIGPCIWGYLLIDGTAWILAGILTAHCDTKYIMVINAVSVWLFCVLPTYLSVNLLNGPPYFIWIVMNIYAISNVLFFAIRSTKWLKTNTKNNISITTTAA